MRGSIRILLGAGLLVGSLLGSSAAAESSSSGSSSSVSASTSASATSSSSSTPSSSSASKFHTVTVGPGYVYNPNTTFANPGDTIIFEFFPTNHSIIRAEYTDAKSCPKGGCNPCVPYELIHPGGVGWHSPNVLTQNVDPNQALTWNLTINDTQSIFFYCDALESCHPNGMVGVINPDETVSLQKQYDAAVSAPYELGPGQPFPAEGNGGGLAAASSTAPTSTATSTPTPSAASSGGSHGLSAGAIAGISVGAFAVVLLAAALFYLVGRNKTYHDLLTGKSSTESAPPGNTSQVGDMGPWSPMSQQHPVGDHRFSAGTNYSHVQGRPAADASFVGYNRHTGAPEFASEVPVQSDRSKSPFVVSPELQQQGFQNTHVSAELPGDTPDNKAVEVAGAKQY